MPINFLWRFLFSSSLIFIFMTPISGQAEDGNCWSPDRSFYSCLTQSGGAVGVSAPVLGDTLEYNPANLPVEDAPLGLEFMGSNHNSTSQQEKLNTSLVKGFDGLGFGIGSWSKGTFAAPNFPPHFLSKDPVDYLAYEQKEKNTLGMRLGTTIVVPKALLPSFFRMSIGGSMGFAQVAGEYSPQLGIVAKFFGLGLGYSENFDRLSTLLPFMRISVYSAGLFIESVYFGYSHSVIRSKLNFTTTEAISMRMPLKNWILYGGWKWQSDHRGVRDDWYRVGLQRKFGHKIGIGYEYGYYRFSHSAIFQLFL